MQILKPMNPIILELTEDDLTLMHLSFYEFKDFLMKTRQIKKEKKQSYTKQLTKIIHLVDLLM